MLWLAIKITLMIPLFVVSAAIPYYLNGFNLTEYMVASLASVWYFCLVVVIKHNWTSNFLPRVFLARELIYMEHPYNVELYRKNLLLESLLAFVKFQLLAVTVTAFQLLVSYLWDLPWYTAVAVQIPPTIMYVFSTYKEVYINLTLRYNYNG